MPELVVNQGGKSRRYDLPEGKALFVGRVPECDIYLPLPGVSRRHAVFLAKNGDCGVKDLDSTNGTFLNGRRLSRAVRLCDGDVLQIADVTIKFRLDSSNPERTSTESRRLNRVIGKQISDAGGVVPPVAPQAAPQSDEPKPIDAAVGKGQPGAQVIDEISASEETPPVPISLESPSPAKGKPAVSELTKEGDKPPLSGAIPEPSASVKEAIDSTRDGQLKRPPVHRVPRATIPARSDISDNEVGDGSDDASFLIEDEVGGDDSGAGDAALNKAASEAGLVGEFNPDTGEDQPSFSADQLNGQAVHSAPASLPAIEPGAQEALEPGSIAVSLDDALREVIEARLYLYSFLSELRSERESIVANRPKLADSVKSELARQDRETEKIPTAEQAEGMIEKRKARHAALIQKIEEAKQNGEDPPPKPSRDMREAEELAITQWTFISQSLREALPAVYVEAFKLAKAEPLVEPMQRANINPVPIMGGAIYYFALERLLEETKLSRQECRTKIALVPDPNENKSGVGLISIFGRKKADDDEDEGEELPAESYEELVAGEKLMADRAAWINLEIAYMEKVLILEFWKVYTELALFYMPEHEQMPLSVRAFLRHGAVGFAPWWMKPEVREYLLQDCREEIVHHTQVSKDITNILYADEYLAAVMNHECTPALDENLEINERNSPNWKADKALRKLINSRSQKTLLEDLLCGLKGRIEGLEAEAAKIEQQIDKLLPTSKNIRAVKSELGQRRQAYKIEISKISKLAAKIRDETLATLEENMAETEKRFASGELPKPTPGFLIKRECEAVRKIGRLLANLKERFMPLVLRDNFQVDTDAVNDRISINGEILEMERRDPGIFLENLVPSKKKANRVDLRISPIVVLLPSAGVLAYSWNPRGKPEDGRLAIPTCFIRRRIRERQITYLLADFRWDTSKAAAGMDIMTSETIVAAFMTVRWDWRKRSKEGREKGLIFTEQNDRTNWRRVYEAYSQTAYDSGKKLFNRNYDFYERIIGKYFDLPEGVPLLKK